MIDLLDTTFLFHVRVDTEERKNNISTVVNFYRKNCKGFKFIFIEDDETENLPSILSFKENDSYIFQKSKDMWNKCKSFNTGIRNSESEILVFHDLDVIINPLQLLTSITTLKENKNYGLMYPYNGLFLCVNKQIKKVFSNTLDYKDLEKYFPYNLSVNYNDGNVLVGHNNSVGGCVLGRRDNILKCNGYNPNFIGWGYEDNEFPKRVHILGFPVTRLNEPRAPLWHLPHDGEGSSPKADNPFYEQNRQLCSYVENSKKNILENYIKNWSI